MRQTVLPFFFILSLLACNFLTESPRALPTVPATPLVQTAEPATAISSPTGTAAVPTPTFDSAKLGTSQLDVTYCTVNGVELKMDVYFPTQMSAPAPAAVYVHGGSWRGGDKRSGVGSGEVSILTGAGFVVFAVNYRLAPAYRFPAMIEDVKCAIRSIRPHSTEYGIDPNRIGAFGASAGGHLVSMLGTTDASAGFDVGEYLEYSSRVQAVVDMCGPADLTLPFSGEQTQRATDVFTADQLVIGSPVSYITADDPPFLILQGDRDQVVPPEQSQVLYNALIAAGVPAELVLVKNASHAFEPAGGEMSPTRAEISLMVLGFLIEHLQ